MILPTSKNVIVLFFFNPKLGSRIFSIFSERSFDNFLSVNFFLSNEIDLKNNRQTCHEMWRRNKVRFKYLKPTDVRTSANFDLSGTHYLSDKTSDKKSENAPSNLSKLLRREGRVECFQAVGNYEVVETHVEWKMRNATRRKKKNIKWKWKWLRVRERSRLSAD